MTRRVPDFISSNQGSIVCLHARNESAANWLAVNVNGGTRPFAYYLPIEHRMFLDIAVGLLSAGFTMQDADTGKLATLPA